ncbi:response regulator transcription factor [Hyphomicrobium sp. LHD-15]|uniref:response regulator transcription factor n=1 Tax=Hyphomicrobium sp. LHD-15 TaxID=3072142 RepID=UPI0028108D90|nr:response regulator transcription factor [Hyphomicrobium sp. LHD-15]MDQ8700644.1 response regulator transcription factor [Hyphomicrobium sp. LHD-15]
MTKRIRVMLVDDHAVVRKGYRTLIEEHGTIEVVCEAADADAAYQLYKTKVPDVVIMDISMPGRGGIDAIRQIRLWDPSGRILVFSMHANAAYALQAFRAGAKGYVTKSSDPELLIAAIESVARNRTALCAEISEALATSRLQGDSNAFQALSPREFEILQLILDAKSTEEIANTLHLAPKTVGNYHYAIKSKLGVVSDIDLVYFCMRQGLIAPLASVPSS